MNRIKYIKTHFNIRNMQILNNLFSAIFIVVLIIPLYLLSEETPDLRRYVDWTNSFIANDPTILPIGQWSFGPGLIYSLSNIFPFESPERCAFFVGWIFSLIFRWAFVGILLNVSNWNKTFVLLGCCIAFTGTNSGYYSIMHASESLSHACFAVMLYWTNESPRRKRTGYL